MLGVYYIMARIIITKYAHEFKGGGGGGGGELCARLWYSGLILGLHPANERRRYFVTTSLIGWTQA